MCSKAAAFRDGCFKRVVRVRLETGFGGSRASAPNMWHSTAAPQNHVLSMAGRWKFKQEQGAPFGSHSVSVPAYTPREAPNSLSATQAPAPAVGGAHCSAARRAAASLQPSARFPSSAPAFDCSPAVRGMLDSGCARDPQTQPTRPLPALATTECPYLGGCAQLPVGSPSQGATPAVLGWWVVFWHLSFYPSWPSHRSRDLPAERALDQVHAPLDARVVPAGQARADKRFSAAAVPSRLGGTPLPKSPYIPNQMGSPASLRLT